MNLLGCSNKLNARGLLISKYWLIIISDLVVTSDNTAYYISVLPLWYL